MMSDRSVDILMVTHNRPGYTRRALTQLLSTCDRTMRVWLWHNGDDEATFATIMALADDPHVHKIHRHQTNVGLWEPTRWVMENGTGHYVSKVDDDCLVPDGWADVLRRAHEDVPEAGVLGCWRFPAEDFFGQLAHQKIQAFRGGHRVLRNCWIEGSGFVMKRACIDTFGPIPHAMSFPQYCIRLAAQGWIHGWYYPFLHQEHMDDPRSRFWEQLHAGTNGSDPASIERRIRKIRGRALEVQRASLDPSNYLGWRGRARRLRRRLSTRERLVN